MEAKGVEKNKIYVVESNLKTLNDPKKKFMNF